MKEEKAEYAGGAVKNKVTKQLLKLDAGDYLVYYKTDDSHSYPDWNEDPPRDRENWGITVFRLD